MQDSPPPTNRSLPWASGLGVLVLGVIAVATHTAALAPPLGVSVYAGLRSPHAPENAPANIVFGHGVGLAAGYFALWICGAATLPGALTGGFTMRHAIASAIAVCLTAFVTERARLPHPPALASTLVASLGLLLQPRDAGGLMLGALLIAGGMGLIRKRSL